MPGTPLRCFPVDAAYFEFVSYLPKDAGMNSLLDRLLAKGRALAAAAGLVEAGKAEQAAAARLRASGRVPINIWGDVLLDGSDPVVRRVLTGKDGHESLLSFFYLNEILALNEVVKAIPAMEASSGWPKPATGRYETLRGATTDPQHHLSQEVLQVFLPAVLFFKLVGQRNTELCELGCTFFSAIDKMKICSSLLDARLDFGTIRCAAVDHSDFFLRGARMFHAGDNVESFLDYKDWSPATPHPFHLSRFVASYAVDSTASFADWMVKFGAFHIIDVINLEAGDFRTTNNGLKQIFFDFPRLIGQFENAGWHVYLNDIAADFNSGQRCAVVKMFGIRGDLDRKLSFAEQVRQIGGVEDLLPMERISEATASAAIARARDSLSAAEWELLAEYKRHFPIWGRPMRELRSMDDVNDIIRDPRGNLSLRFSSGQINFYVRQALGEG